MDRSVDVAAAQREVIDADHVRRRAGRRIGQAEDQPQQRAAVHRCFSATWDSNPASVLRVLFG